MRAMASPPIPRRRRAGMLLALALAALPGAPRAEQPLSAIDWLSRDLKKPVEPRRERVDPPPPVEEIGVTPLAGPSVDAAGLVEAARTGLPADFWGATPSAELARLIAAQPAGGLPAANALLLRILLAELDPPVDAGEALFLARIDKLADLGALDQALALADQDSAPDRELFRRRFDMALLTGREDAACADMLARPALAPGLAARVFCLARNEDWPAAAVTLEAGRALDEIAPGEAEVLARFLEPELAEDEALAPPSPMTPLIWRVMEAAGDPQPSQNLPLAYAQADLRANTGWKARIEAGERLTRSGALAPNALHGLYTERAPAASGGVWDRARAIQDLDKALYAAEQGDEEQLTLILPQVWARIAEAELEVPVAEIYGPRLAALRLAEPAGPLAHRIALLGADPAAVAQAMAGRGGEPFLDALARGNLRGIVPPDRMAGAVRDGFRAGGVPPDLQAMIEGGRRGEAVLSALLRLSAGMQGDLRAVTEGIATLRAVGLDLPARHVGLQLVILDRRG